MPPNTPLSKAPVRPEANRALLQLAQTLGRLAAREAQTAAASEPVEPAKLTKPTKLTRERTTGVAPGR
jgi:hypothetical protein